MPIFKRFNKTISERREKAVTEGMIAELNEKIEMQNDLIKQLASKTGYTLEAVGETEAGSQIFEFVKDNTDAPTGDYLNPIQIPSDGTTTEVGKWYYVDDKDLPHEAKQNAFVMVEDFNDRTWFDFV